MKKIIYFTGWLFIAANIIAQTPQKMNYQAVIRNSSNNLITNTNVSMKISILQGSSSGTSIYEEAHSPTSNANGLVSIAIGGGTPISGSFASIDWGSNNYFIKTETDPNGGSNYSISGTSELLSVPYALHSDKVKIPLASNTNTNSYLMDLSNTSTANGVLKAQSASTIDPAISAKLTSTGGASYVSAIEGINESTTGSGIGITGKQNGSGWGVYGSTASGIGVVGSGNIGIWGKSTTVGGSGIAGVFTDGKVGINTFYPSTILEVVGSSANNDPAIKTSSNNAAQPALELNGSIKVSGANKLAFTVQGQNTNSSATGYTTSNLMYINHPLCNGDPNAIIIVSHNWSTNGNMIYLNKPIGVYYDNSQSRWSIYLEDTSTMPLTAFNVLVIKQ